MKHILPTAIAIGTALVVLFGYLIPAPELITARAVLTDWAVIAAALAVLLGVANVIIANARRVQTGAQGWFYNLLTVLAVLVMLTVGILESLGGAPAIYEQTSLTQVLFTGIVVASQAALASMLVFFMVAAAVRLLRLRPNRWSVLFLIVVIFALLSWIPLSLIRPLQGLRDWVLEVPAMAGARGILIGVALAILVFGLRVLTGVERPYRD